MIAKFINESAFAMGVLKVTALGIAAVLAEAKENGNILV